MRRHRPHNPPPPDGVERRKELRRETDVEKDEITERAVAQVTWLNRLFKTGKVASAVGAVCLVLGGAAGRASAMFEALGGSTRMPKQAIDAVNLRVDTNAARIVVIHRGVDSLREDLHEMKADLETIKILACISVLRANADAATVGRCDERGKKP
jgi:hypothetical protein